jgi:uncharacterized protein (TIGR03000 family)
MSLHRLLSWTIPSLVALTFAFTPSLSSAAPRGGGGGYRGGYGGGYGGGGYGGYGYGPYNDRGFRDGNPYYGGDRYNYDRYPAPDSTVYTPPATPEVSTTQSFYPASSPATARVSVTLPMTGQVTFGSYRTSQSAGPKAYETPALTPGKTYSYDIQATWMENGRQVSRTRTVTVHAGEQVTADFSRASE